MSFRLLLEKKKTCLLDYLGKKYYEVFKEPYYGYLL